MRSAIFSTFLILISTSTVFAAEYRIDVEKTINSGLLKITCRCQSNFCKSQWDDGEHSLADCDNGVTPEPAKIQESSIITTPEGEISFRDSSEGISYRSAYVGGVYVGGVVLHSEYWEDGGNTEYCSENYCYYFYEKNAITTISGTISVTLITPDPSPSPPADDNSNCRDIICECIEGLKTILSEILEILKTLSGQQEAPDIPGHTPAPRWTPPNEEPLPFP